MKIGFYYHVTIFEDSLGDLFVPSYLGVFIDSLAGNVDNLYLYLHSDNSASIVSHDYKIQAQNIFWNNLGSKNSPWKREMLHKKILINAKGFNDIDFLIVRSPSPLAPYFRKFLDGKRICYLVVGEYKSSIDFRKKNVFRQLLIKLYLKYNTIYFTRAIKNQLILCNSRQLYDNYKVFSELTYNVFTTTLSDNDFFKRYDTCTSALIRILYVGRLDMKKGLGELMIAAKNIITTGRNIEISFVGWDDSNGQIVEKELRDIALHLGIFDFVRFCGKKSIGSELNEFYRNSDVFVLPSYQEGFPRVVWEAMANSLPVVITNVGSIPSLLTSDENCVMIPPRNTEALTAAIERVIGDGDLRKRIINNGRSLAKEKTLKKSTEEMLEIIKNHV